MVIPSLDAAGAVGRAIRSAPPGAEVLVVDGGSGDATVAEAGSAGARVLLSSPGRARQMNLGAREARGRVLLFLHADCRLPPDAEAQIERALAQPGAVGGWFPQRVETASRLLRGGARRANRRARWLRLPYGDQAIFVRRSAFLEVGGFPDDPIMEDAAFARRIRRVGLLVPTASPVTTGDEHWRRLGPVLTAVLDNLTLLAWLAGAPPRRLAPLYRRLHRGAAVPATGPPGREAARSNR